MLGVGIDLGTTYSCIAVYRNGQPDVIINNQGNRITPSVVAFTDTERLVGESAKNQALLNPDRTIYSAKRLMGKKISDTDIKIQEKFWPFTLEGNVDGQPLIKIKDHLKKEAVTYIKPEEISAAVLQHLCKFASEALGEPIRDVVITCPAYFTDAQRQATKDAGAIAGLNVLQLISEPCAAATCYGYFDKKQHQEMPIVLVFDLGGGTLDVSIAQIFNGTFETKAVTGDNYLGGEDFDTIITEYAIQEFMQQYPDDTDQISTKSKQRLRQACEVAKKNLSTATMVNITVDQFHKEKDLNVTLSRARFEHLCQGLFTKIKKVLEKSLRHACIPATAVDKVILVGGSSRIPKISTMLSEMFDRATIEKSINPDEAVACGAAIKAHTLLHHHHHHHPDQQLFMKVIDVCPFSIGIQSGFRDMNVIIPRNSPIPCSKSQIFTTQEDNQPGVTIVVFEGEKPLTCDNHLLGKFDLLFDETFLRGEPQIKVTLALDQNGILVVTAMDLLTQKQKEISIECPGITTEELKLISQRMEQYEFDDFYQVQLDQKVNEAEKFLLELKDSLEKDDEKHDEEDLDQQEKIEQIEQVLNWLKNNKKEITIENLEEKMKLFKSPLT